MQPKYIFLLLLLQSTIINTAEVQQQPANSYVQWFKDTWAKNPIRTLMTKLYTYQATRDKLLSKVAQKKQEYANANTDEITDPAQAAEKFKAAVAKNNETTGNTEPFIFGVSSSSYQTEGGLDATNANAFFYKSRNLPPAEDAINFWNKYKDDIPQIKQKLSINGYRLSIAWERVQPEKPESNDPKWNMDAIIKYADIIKTLKENNIEPIVVLHHYTIPQWFAELDGFEKQENNAYFVEFAKKMYTALHKHVTYWSTFNAIEGYAFKGYHKLEGPPGNPSKKSLWWTQRVIANMLDAHVQVYQAIKGKDGLYQKYAPAWAANIPLPTPQIGIQKNIVFLDPIESRIPGLRFLTLYTACFAGENLQNDGFFNFFNNGIFKMYTPFKVELKNPLAPTSLDWIGLNTYSNISMWFTRQVPEKNPALTTANANYRYYPEGIYRGVKLLYTNIAKPLGKKRNKDGKPLPIIITENGIATTNDDTGNEKRTRFFMYTLNAIRKLLEEGIDIRGYTPWACHDNYEWPTKEQPDPYDRPYGMFAVDRRKGPTYLDRTLKKGAEYYAKFLEAYFE